MLQLRQPRIPPVQEVAQQHRIVGADGGAHRRPRRQRLSPARKLRFAGQYSKVGDAVEHIEIAEYRAEHRIDQREILAIEPRRCRNARLEPRKTLLRAAPSWLRRPPRRARRKSRRYRSTPPSRTRSSRDARRASTDRPGAAVSAGFPRDIRESRPIRKSPCRRPAAPGSCRAAKSRETSPVYWQGRYRSARTARPSRSARSPRAAHRGKACG